MSQPAPETVPVREAQRFDEAALEGWLAGRIEGFRGPLAVQQFRGGQSNPTFLLTTPGRRYVLRKKPPGRLLPSAHMVEREHKVISALAGTGVPVARTWLLCEDEAVIGTPFYIMDYVTGRIFREPLLPGMAPAERAAIYDAMNEVLARLHSVVPEDVGLGDFGRPGNYYARQIDRWTRQYEAARTGEIAAMDRLARWLPENIPPGDEVAVVHGDYRLENMIFHPTEPRVLAVLDWELATLGHPLADLAYNCMLYHIDLPGTVSLKHRDPASGIPSEQDYVAAYVQRTGRQPIARWNFYLAFSLFRSAGILQGVYKRSLQGNAASETAGRYGAVVPPLAEKAWELAESA